MFKLEKDSIIRVLIYYYYYILNTPDVNNKCLEEVLSS
jgi:hypothetical protein